METWFRQLIANFREEVSKLTTDEKMRITNLDNLSPPCQVDVIWFQNKQFALDYQLIIYQHFNDRPDLEINIHGPVPFYEAVDELDRILSHEKWSRNLAISELYFIEDGDRTLRRIIEGEFLSALEELRTYTLNIVYAESARPVTISRKMHVTKECFAWFVWGNISLNKPEEIVNDIVKKSIAQTPIQSQKPDTNMKVSTNLKAYGTYFYPPVWIGDIQKRSFKEKARKQFFPKSGEILITKYRDFQTIIHQDGLLVIVNEDKVKTLDMLNEIMGVALVLGLPCYSIREPEVGEITIDSETFTIKGSTMSLVSDRTRQASPWIMPSYIPMMIQTTFLLSEVDIMELLNRTGRIVGNVEVKKSLLFLLESYTHLQSSEYLQCFVMGWTVIEKYIASIWDEFLKGKSISTRRRQKLTQGLLWTTDDIIETLNLTETLDALNYDILMNLKEKRNKILHRGEIASKDDADQCFNLALTLVQKSVESIGELNLIHPQHRLLGLRD